MSSLQPSSRVCLEQSLQTTNSSIPVLPNRAYNSLTHKLRLVFESVAGEYNYSLYRFEVCLFSFFLFFFVISYVSNRQICSRVFTFNYTETWFELVLYESYDNFSFIFTFFRKRNSEQDSWRNSWGQYDQKDEFWTSFESNYQYLMNNNLIDSCKVSV